MTNAAPIWYNISLGDYRGIARTNVRANTFLSSIIPQKNFYFKSWQTKFYKNFTKKFFKKVLTSPGVLWYNKRGIYFFFFLGKKFRGARDRSSSSYWPTHPEALPPEANKCSTNKCLSTFLVDTRTIVRFQVSNSTHHYYILKIKKSQYFCINFFNLFLLLTTHTLPLN